MFFNLNAEEKALAATLLYYIIKTGLIDRKLIVVPHCNTRFRDINDSYFNGWINAMTAIAGPPISVDL